MNITILIHCKIFDERSIVQLQMNVILITGLIVSVIASILMAYGRIFRSRHEMEKESEGDLGLNESKMKHKLIETRVAQIGAILLVVGFIGNLPMQFTITAVPSITKMYISLISD